MKLQQHTQAKMFKFINFEDNCIVYYSRFTSPENKWATPYELSLNKITIFIK